MPAILWFEGDGWGVHIHEEIPVPAEGDSKQKAAVMTQEVARLFEAGIRAHPQDWHMLQKVFVADLDPARLAAAAGAAGARREGGHEGRPGLPYSRDGPGGVQEHDFGDEDMAEAEAEIGSGAPLEIPEVPPIPELPMQVSDGKLAAAAVPEPDAVARHDDTAADSGTYAPPPDPEGTRSWLGNSLAGRAGVVPAAQHAWPPAWCAPAARCVTGWPKGIAGGAVPTAVAGRRIRDEEGQDGAGHCEVVQRR